MTEATSIPLTALIELASSQLEVAMQNAAAQVEQLAGSIATFVELGAQMCTHPDGAIAAQGVRVAAEAQRAIVAMQFHDQLAQRVQHVRDALADLHGVLAQPATPDATALLAAIRARYTMEDERRLFDVVVGTPARAPWANADSEHEALRGSVELF